MTDEDGKPDNSLDEELPDNVVHVDFGQRRGASGAALAEVVDHDDELSAAKCKRFTELVDAGMVMVNLDSRVSGVDVPPQLRGLTELRLNFSHRFGLDDFVYDEKGVRGSLSFDGQPYYCIVPWSAVFMLFSHADGAVYLFEHPED